MKLNEEELKSLNGLVPFLKKGMGYNDIRKWDYIHDMVGNKIEVALLFEKPTGFGDMIFYVPIRLKSILLSNDKVQLEDRRDKHADPKRYTINMDRFDTMKVRNHVLERVNFLEEHENKKRVDEFIRGRGNGST